jgi:hypothetical protein
MRHSVFMFVVMLCVVSGTAYADDWNGIDCSVSKLTIPGFTDLKCQQGPDGPPGTGGCLIEEYFATSNSGDFSVQLITTPGVKCFLNRPSNMDDDIKHFYSWLSDATGWTSDQDIAGATGAYLLNRGDHCFSFYKPGPQRSGSGGSGVSWDLHGVYCVTRSSLDNQAVASFINSIQVKQ